MMDIKFEVIIIDNNKKICHRFNEWLVQGEGWKHDYYSPLVTNGVFDFMELGDGWFGDIIRRQYTGIKDIFGREIYVGDILDIGGIIGEIVWSGLSFYFDCNGKNHWWNDDWYCRGRDIFKITDIYEQGEL